MRLSLLLAILPLAACSPQPLNEDDPEVAAVNIDAIDSAADHNIHAAPGPLEGGVPTTAPGTPEVPDVRISARYRCMDGSKIAVRFDRDNGRATVVREGKTLATLRAEPAGSGIHYAGSGYEVRGKGDDLTFTQPNLPPLACTTIR